MKFGKEDIIKKTNSTEKYFSDLANKQYQPLSKKEEQEYFKKFYETGDPKYRTKILNANLKFVIKVAHEKQHPKIPIDDLINEGNLGLIRAFETYNPTFGYKFISYAVNWIKQYISIAIYKDALIRIPVNVITDARTDDSIILPNSISLNKNYADNNNFTLLDVLKNNNSISPDYKFNIPNVDRILNLLPPAEKDIIIRYFGLKGKKSKNFREIAIEDDRSHQRCQQMFKKAIYRLKMKLKDVDFNSIT